MEETMLDEAVEQYLESLVVSSVVRRRVSEIVQIYRGLTPADALEGIFVSETVDSDGQRVLNNLWLYGNDFFCEAKNFLHEDDFDAIVSKSVQYWNMKFQEFTPGESPSTKSRAKLRFRFTSTAEGLIDASGDNCAHLVKFFERAVKDRVWAAEPSS